MLTNEERLWKETADLAEMLVSAERMAEKALEHVATVRRHHQARLTEWREACSLTSSSSQLKEIRKRLDEELNGTAGKLGSSADTKTLIPHPALPAHGDDAAAERRDIVASALKTAEANRDIPRIEGVAICDEGGIIEVSSRNEGSWPIDGGDDD